MKRIRNFWWVGVGLLLAVALLTPGLGQAIGEPGSQPGLEKERIAKDLGLTPDKAQAFLAVDEKYDRSRQVIIEEITKDEGELEKSIAAPQPDGAKITGLVTAITNAHSKLWETFKVQRQEEMALLTPVQQGKFLMALKKWHQEMCVRFDQQEKKN